MVNYITYYYDKNPEKSEFYKDCYLKLKNQLESYGNNLIGDNIDFKKLKIEAYDKLNLYKPTFILNKLEQIKTPVVWIDSDCTVREKITEFDDINCDIAFAIREHDQKTPHAGLIYFSASLKSIEFLKEWEMLCEEKKYIQWDCTEHCLLVDLFNKLDNSYTINRYHNLASISLPTKVQIGISPAGWEYEKNKVKK